MCLSKSGNTRVKFSKLWSDEMFDRTTNLIRLGCLIAVAFTWAPAQSADPDSATRVVASSVKDRSLVNAVKRQSKSRIERLLDQEVDVNQTQGDGATALHWAAHHNDLDTARKLIKAGANVEAKNALGVMPLWLACTNGNAEMIELLVDAGANVNEPLETGETPLMTASRTGSFNSVKVLLTAGAEVDAIEPIRKQTALMWALGESHTDIAKTLVAAGADINVETTKGSTPLMFAVRHGNLEATKWLIEKGAYVNAKTLDKVGSRYAGTQKKISTLHLAAQRGHVDVALELIRNGADVNDGEAGYTALHWTVGTWETDINGGHGIKPDRDHEWNMMRGVQEGKFELVQALVEAGADVNAKLEITPTKYGFSNSAGPGPLVGANSYLIAAWAGDTEIMQYLLDHGADPLVKTQGGQTALHLAGCTNRLTSELAMPVSDLVAALALGIEHGIDVNVQDKGGNTAMHGAAWVRSVEMIDLLYAAGADVNAKNYRGQNPQFIADHSDLFAGGTQITLKVRSPTGLRIAELSVPAVVKESIDKWSDLPPHIRKSVRSLLQGELENMENVRARATVE